MPILGVLSLIIQVFFAVHAIRTGRDRYWIFIIIIFPGIGCLIYFFSEYLPDLRQGPGLKKAQNGIVNIVNPGKRIRDLEEQLDLTPSVNNKKALAAAYTEKGMFDKAIALYEDCLKGPYESDPYIMEGLSLACFFSGDFERAKETLLQLVEIRGDRKRDDFDLLLARTYDELGDTERSLEEYSKLQRSFSGEEARCRYALLLKRLGRKAEADRHVNEISKNARLSPKYYKKTQ
ncbi:MAG: tetratricopeptide repeat protein, partial [Desulfobacterales bacterium]|nr:tetratricopeptide repeat protein [Desulfobacterales bacterium]